MNDGDPAATLVLPFLIRNLTLFACDVMQLHDLYAEAG